MIELTMTRRMDVPAERLWQVFGTQYAEIGGWISGVYASRPRAGDPIGQAPVLGRECMTDIGKHPVVETIQDYDPTARHVRYAATSKSFPGFMRAVTNSWTFHDLGNGQTEVRVQGQLDVAFPVRLLMRGLIRAQFRKTMTNALDDLEHFARTGQKSRRKERFDASAKAAQVRAGFA